MFIEKKYCERCGSGLETGRLTYDAYTGKPEKHPHPNVCSNIRCILSPYYVDLTGCSNLPLILPFVPDLL